MAKNWTLKEAAAIIAAGENKEALVEITKRYPLTAMALAKAGTNAGLETLFGGMPDHVTMLKLERSLKDGVSESEDEDEEETDGAGEDAGNDTDEDLSTKTTKELYAMCQKRGIKANKYGKPKSYYIDLLTNAGDKADDEEDAEDEKEKATEEQGYEEMSAPELYKLCKKRGIKAEPKQKAAVYVKLLKKADEEAATEDGEDDDWDDEEEEGGKASKKGAAKEETKKPASGGKKKAAAEEDDDDDDWDI